MCYWLVSWLVDFVCSEGKMLSKRADSLEAINSPLSSKDMVIYALAGLPSEYESFIRTVTNKNSSLTFDELRAKLLYQEQRLQHLHGAYDSSSQVAFVAASYNVYYYIMRELGQSAVLDFKSSNDGN